MGLWIKVKCLKTYLMSEKTELYSILWVSVSIRRELGENKAERPRFGHTWVKTRNLTISNFHIGRRFHASFPQTFHSTLKIWSAPPFKRWVLNLDCWEKSRRRPWTPRRWDMRGDSCPLNASRHIYSRKYNNALSSFSVLQLSQSCANNRAHLT